MGRWKANNDGSAYYDGNDSGPNQAAPPGQTGGTGDGMGGPSPEPEQPQHGWGPIKISGTYQPHPNSPGDFWHHIGDMGGQPGQGEGPGGLSGRNDSPGGNGPVGFPGNGRRPWDEGGFPGGGATGGQFPGGIMAPFPGGGQGPLWKHLMQSQGPNPNAPTPNAGETPQEMFQRFQNDYHSPDKDQVMDTMKDSNYYGTMMHTMGDPGMQINPDFQMPPGGGPIGLNPGNHVGIPNPSYQPHHGGFGGIFGALGGGLSGMAKPVSGGGTSLIQQLLARQGQNRQF